MKAEERTITKELMQGLAHAIDVALKTELKTKYGICKGFALLVFDFNNSSGTVDYIANAERKQMIEVLKETATRLELKQDIPPIIGSA